MNDPEIVGEILDGKYDIKKTLGKGGMGSVYLASHVGTERHVAVKVIAPEFMAREEFVERFRREARAAGRLRHPNVVDVTDFGFSKIRCGDNVAYLVMEFLDGCTLGEVLAEEESLPLSFSVEIIEQVCSAVEEAHRQGIIHRDLKPDNIWLEPNLRGGYTVKVLDFGIAKLDEGMLPISADSIPESFKTGTKTQVIQDNETLVDGSATAQKTVVSQADSENRTVILPDGNSLGGQTPSSETEQEGSIASEISSEDKTAVFQTSDEEALDENGTRIINRARTTDNSALRLGATSNLTRVGAVLGTPLYMSPEQCRGEELTTSTDIYSLAIIAYQMLSGKLPFEGDYLKVMDAHKNEAPPELVVKKAPKHLKRIVMQSLAKNPEDRPNTAESFSSKIRANSEGLGAVMRRSLITYSMHLPKFLKLALLIFIPPFILTFARLGFGLLVGAGYIADNVLSDLVIGFFALVTFIIQIIAAGFLVGMTTWVVGQTIAYPLREINLSGALEVAKRHWRRLAFAVTLSTITSLASLVVGILSAFVAWILVFGALFLYVGRGVAIVAAAVIAIIASICLFAIVSGHLMLVAPSVMMEGIGVNAAFRRSVKLASRARRTVISTAIIIFFIPMIFASVIAISIDSAIDNYQLKSEIRLMKIEGVEPQKEIPKKSSPKVGFSVNGKGVELGSAASVGAKDSAEDEESSENKGFAQALQEAIFGLIWTPLAFLISSFTAVVTALIYFKTRQAGGESTPELLATLDDGFRSECKWQQQMRDRQILSGIIRSDTGSKSGA